MTISVKNVTSFLGRVYEEGLKVGMDWESTSALEYIYSTFHKAYECIVFPFFLPLSTWLDPKYKKPQTSLRSGALDGIPLWRFWGTCPPQQSQDSLHTQTTPQYQYLMGNHVISSFHSKYMHGYTATQILVFNHNLCNLTVTFDNSFSML